MSRLTLAAIAATFVLLSPTVSHAAVKQPDCRWKSVGETEVEFADQALQLTPVQRSESLATHLPWSAPTNPIGADNEQRLVNHHFIINHAGDLHTATWTAHRLRADDLETLARHEAFRSDPRLDDDEAATCCDYKKPIYDQGHLVPSADMTRSLNAMLNTYTMSNMAPQYCAFNRGTWRGLETVVRRWMSVALIGRNYLSR